MTMEPIQKTTGTYQGSTPTVEKAQNTVKVQEQMTEEQAAKSTANEPVRQADKIATLDKASDSSLKKAVDEINRSSPSMEAIFGYHEGTNRVIIKIMDKDTKEVKKEYPAEQTLDMIQKVWEMAGLMVDEKR